MFKKHALALVSIPLTGLILMIAILGVRNIYDDELNTLASVHLPYGKMVEILNSTDIHPPAMYVLDKLAYQVTGSNRWLSLLPTLFWFCGTFFFVMSVLHVFQTRWGATLFIAVAFMHPQVLMWCDTMRWYPYWTGMALAILAGGLFPLHDTKTAEGALPSFKRCVLLGVGFAALFYLNYFTLPFSICYAAAWMARYGISKDTLKRLLCTAAVAILLSAPQLIVLITVHLPHARKKDQFRPFVTAGAHLLHGLTVGESMLPLAPIAVLTMCVFLLPGFALAARVLYLGKKSLDERDRCIRTLAVLFVTVSAFAILTGLGASPRNVVILAPIAAFFLAIGAETVRAPAWRWAASIVIALWIGFAAHNLLLRTGTSKGAFNDHYDEVVKRVLELSEGEPSVIVTYNGNLSSEFNDARLKHGAPIALCSEEPDNINSIDRGFQGAPLDFKRVIVIESYPYPESNDPLRPLLKNAKDAIIDPVTIPFGFDPDAKMKAFLARQPLPDYRFSITYGHAKSFDWIELGKQLAQLCVERDRKLNEK